MHVAFVKLEKFEKINYDEVNGNLSDKLKSFKVIFINILNWIKYKIRIGLNYIKEDKQRNIFYISNFNKNSINKIDKILAKREYDFALTENDININYNTINLNMITKYILPEIKKYVFDILKPSIDEIYICTNVYNDENVSIILDLINDSKVVNVITENQMYFYLEKQMESKEIYFNVLSNKRKSLKKASFIINLDYMNLNGFNLNRNSVIVDVTNNMLVPQGFNGVIIKKCKINTKKMLRIFSEFKNFNKDKLIVYEILKNSDYNVIREKIKQDKVYIDGVYNNRKIEKLDIKRLSNFEIVH